MFGPRKRMRAGLWSVVLGAILLTGCGGGDNETPASADPVEIVLLRVVPADAESSVPRNRVVRLEFNTTVLPESVNEQTIQIRTGGQFQTFPPGSFQVSANIVIFDPTVLTGGGENAAGFDAGVQILVRIPLFDAENPEPSNQFIRNVEGNPITTASQSNQIQFITGAGWDDPTQGTPPGVLDLEFTPGPNSVGQVPSNAAVTVVFDEPIDPASVLLAKNIFLTNNTETSQAFQLPIPALTFFDGSLRRYTFLPVFGYGTGPFSIRINFIDPAGDPDDFDPTGLPTDLGGNQLVNFTFFQDFVTQFDPSTVNTGLITENFEDSVMRDPDPTLTDAIWSDDPEFPFTLVGQNISTRVQTVNVNAIITLSGGVNQLPNNGGPNPEGRYCPTVELSGDGLQPFLGQGAPPASAGRRTLNIYRASELGDEQGTITRISWGPDSDAVFAGSYPRVILRLGHKETDTSLGAGSFFDNFDTDGFVEVADSDNYQVPLASDVNGNGIMNDGFFQWPDLEAFFEFNGTGDLLMDIDADAGTTWQQMRTYLNVTNIGGAGNPCSCNNFFACGISNSIGNRRIQGVFGGDAADPPGNAALGVLQPGPFVLIQEFELTKLLSVATSRFYCAGPNIRSQNPDQCVTDPQYAEAILAPTVQGGGATVTLMFSGSQDGITEDVPFTDTISDLNGMKFMRFRAELRANLFTGLRALLESIQVPFTFE